jgi:S1-C subfamily serine protease
MKKIKNTLYISFISGLVGGSAVFISLFAIGDNIGNAFSIFNFNDKNQQTQQQKVEKKQESNEPKLSKKNSKLRNLNQLTIDVVDESNPSVVNISIYKDVTQYEVRQQQLPSPFDRYFQIEPQIREKSTENIKVGGGSGFIVDSDGIIVTNKHVVSQDNVEYKIQLSNGNTYQAKVIARDPIFDLAMMKIDAKEKLAAIELGDSNNLKIGETVIAIGNALSEFENTVTRGIVSGIGRKIRAGGGNGEVKVIDKAIQTDAAINPGNSGGPLLNLEGKVIGINTAVSEQGQSVGFAIPINQVKQTIESVIKQGEIIHPWLGVRYIQVNSRVAQLNKLPVDYGALIVGNREQNKLAVIPGSPADKASLKVNDIILRIEGAKITEENDLQSIISQKKVGEEISLEVLQNGERKTIETTLEKRPSKNKK